MPVPTPRAVHAARSSVATASLLATAALCAATPITARAQPAATKAAALAPMAAVAVAAPDRTVAPDTVSAVQLAHGVPLTVRVLRADGSPAASTGVTWRVLRGDVAFTAVHAHTDADGYATATLGRAPWLRARSGPVVVEARAAATTPGAPARRVAFAVVAR